MNKYVLTAAAAALGVCGVVPAALAQPRAGGSNIDGYYASAHLDYNDADPIFDFNDDGDGWGVKGAFELAPQVFLIGEYQSNSYDDSDIDLDEYRIGGAFGEGAGNGNGLYGKLQYANYDGNHGVGETDGGVGHIGYGLLLSPEFKLFGEAGYIKLDDTDGPEFVVGGTYQFTPNLGLYADYRYTRLEDKHDSDTRLDLEDFRVGARFYF